MTRDERDAIVNWVLVVIAAIAVLVVLMGCETTRTVYQPPQVVDVPVAASCLPSTRPTRPVTYTDAELAGFDSYRFVIALRWNADRLTEYVAELEAVLLRCG